MPLLSVLGMERLFESACRQCQDVLRYGWPRERMDFEYAEKSAKLDGCRPCLLVYRAITELDICGSFRPPQWNINELYLYRGGRRDSEEPHLKLKVKLWHPESSWGYHGYHTKWLTLFTTRDMDPAWEWAGLIPKLTPDFGSTASEKSLEWTREMLKKCEETHTKVHCNKKFRPRLPTRILDVGTGPWHPQQDIKLYVTKKETQRYMCLSHCWGTVKTIKTTTANFSEFQKRIRWDNLPLTFQDAVHFTRRLGFRYLWIDSLCIVQDDINDWKRESVKMAEVYQGAALTIAAAVAKGDDYGLHSSAANAFPPIHTLEWPGVHGGQIHFSEYAFNGKDKHIDSVFHKDSRVQSDEFPLLSRGWVVQERLLSRRFLLFTSHELIWECGQESTCECESDRKIIRSQPMTSEHFPKDEFWRQFALPLMEQGTGDFGCGTWQGRTWRQLVTYFVRRNLTMPTDRLAAISGMAKEFHARRKCRYIAGLWEDTFVYDLAWGSEGPLEDRKGRVFPPQAPSWSWASVQNPYIDFYSIYPHKEKPLPGLEIVKVDCQSSGEDGFGGPIYGSVTLRGHIIEATYTIQKPYDKSSLWYLQVEKIGQWRSTTNDREWGKIEVDCNRSEEGWVEYLGGEPIYLVPLLGDLGSRDIQDGMIHGYLTLLVLKCIDKKSRTFERLGMFRRGWEELGVPATEETIVIV
ncbi:heterokaryon incompatibility protein-domain-containing protein [Immersiella caudata]|uniref:Heterokaryon incompatibility protein-domain-containing protein n=1 Tax=Immersiella caudata TaxID=314043 RepID=A0AA39T1J9_9PEZI|nr:heterokaryon incompatibility protein-domain-containing protein [Immersiella caudata]